MKADSIPSGFTSKRTYMVMLHRNHIFQPLPTGTQHKLVNEGTSYFHKAAENSLHTLQIY